MGAPGGGRQRGLLFAGLYLCEGAPIGFLWWALPTILRERGVEVDRIGALTSWLVLPWALKFLWAPLLDAGGARGLVRWIVGAQAVMALTLLPLLGLGEAAELEWIVAALVLHAVAAASQDAAIDSLAIRATPAGERGRLNAWMQGGMLVGRSLFGGGALLARTWIGDAGVVIVLAAGLAAAALGLRLGGVLTLQPETPLAREPLGLRLRRALERRGTWLGLLFAALSGAGFETVGALAGPFLIDEGASAGRVGTFFGLPSVGATILGAVLGGRAADRLGPRRAVLLSGLAVPTLVLGMAALARDGLSVSSWLFLLTALYLGIGAFTASSYALFMALTDPGLGATQFSAYMGATNLCESWSARLGGALARERGYASAIAWPALVSLLALPLLAWLRPRAGNERP